MGIACPERTEPAGFVTSNAGRERTAERFNSSDMCLHTRACRLMPYTQNMLYICVRRWQAS